MLVYLVKAHRGSIYSPKGQRSRCSFIWKALVAFCPWVHRTVRCTPDIQQCAISFLKRPSRPLAIPPRLAHRTVRCTPDSPVHTGHVRCGPPTVGAGDMPATWPPSIAPDRWAQARAVGWLAHRTVRCTPDSPVNYSHVAWLFSRERPVRPLSRPAMLTVYWAGHRTVRCTPDSPVLPRLDQVWPNFAKLVFFNSSRLVELPST
jgi:hypothetical protein